MRDVRSLAQSLVFNGQPQLPPNDVIRQGVVVGYDPSHSSTGHSYPVVSVQIAGDASPLHGIRFAETYNPNLGDTVWCVLSGEDIWVMCRLTDTPNANGTTRAPSTPGVIGHGEFNDVTGINSGTATPFRTASVTTSILPNRIYKIEVSFSFNITNANPTDVFSATWTNNATNITIVGTTSPTTTGLYSCMSIAGDGIPAGTTITAVQTTTITISQQAKGNKNDVPITVTSTHALSCGIMTPSGYYEMNTRNVTNGIYTASGHTTWTNKNTSGNYPNNWTGTFPNAQFRWYFAAKTSATGGTLPTARGVFQRIVIHDLGTAT